MKAEPQESLFVQRMKQFITEEQLLPMGSSVCCALSGGADSVALLLGLLELREPLALTVTAVHINHHLRGAESDRDELFCRDLCQRLDVPLHVRHCDISAYQKKHGGSVETAARACRYALFSKEDGWIATAHTASDHLETIIQRLVRGTGLHGLTGIPVHRDRLIRPLLFASRQEVEAFLQACGQSYVTDSTNQSDAYTRNWIRHKIVPLLQELNPSVEKTALQMSHTLRRDDLYFQEETSRFFHAHFRAPSGLERISCIPEAVLVRCLTMLLEQNAISYDAKMLQRMMQIVPTGGRCHLSGIYDCLVSRDELMLVKRHPEPQKMRVMQLKLGRQTLFAGFSVQTMVIHGKKDAKDFIVDRKFTNCLLDYDKIKGNVILRSRKPGDRMQLAERDFTISIKKRIQEEIPLHRRGNLHFLEDEAGTIFAEGIGIAERVKPEADETENLLVVTVYPDDQWSDEEKNPLDEKRSE